MNRFGPPWLHGLQDPRLRQNVTTGGSVPVEQSNRPAARPSSPCAKRGLVPSNRRPKCIPDPASEAAHKPERRKPAPAHSIHRRGKARPRLLRLQPQCAAQLTSSSPPIRIPQSASFSFPFPPAPTRKAARLPKVRALNFNCLEVDEGEMMRFGGDFPPPTSRHRL